MSQTVKEVVGVVLITLFCWVTIWYGSKRDINPKSCLNTLNHTPCNPYRKAP